MKIKKRLLCLLLSAAMLTAAVPGTAAAKTTESAKGEVLFFYAADAAGNDVLMDVIPISELETLAHNNADTGKNYMYSSTDNYPTTQYAEGQGFTIPELVEYVKKDSSVQGASALTFSGSDSMGFMATDSYGNYTRTWTADELYGQDRYYFEGLYDSTKGWNTGWEVGGDDNSKYGLSLGDYNAKYAATDTYNAAKKEVFAGGVKMPVILATESYSGRTTSQTLTASTEPGLASYITAAGGVVAGCLADALSEDYSLRLCIPMTEADLMAAHRTSYDNFKWVYNVRLDNSAASGANGVKSLGTVAAPTSQVSVSGNTMTISMSCETAGADIYYSFDGSPQIRYTGPVTYDVTGRDLTSSPVTYYMHAVKDGFDDAGIVTEKYPQSGVSFQTLYSSQIGTDITFTADTGVTDADWNSWSSAIMGISLKKPQTQSYDKLAQPDYKIDNSSKTISFDKSLFSDAGSYSFIVYAKGFSNKNFSVSMKKAAPTVSSGTFDSNGPVTLTFSDPDYQKSLYIYATPSGDSSGSHTQTAAGNSDSTSTDGTSAQSVLIPTTYLDRTVSGQVVIKSEYFASESCSMKGAGTYTLELTNNSYAPATQKVQITLTGGNGENPGTAGDGTYVNGFTDVKSDAWYAEAVKYAADNGLFNGTSATTFGPDGNMTRAMLVTVLYRMDQKTADSAVSGSQTADGNTADGTASDSQSQTADSSVVSGAVVKTAAVAGFTDVESGAYYADAVTWASEKGIVNGVTADSFAPDSSITREQMAAILSRYGKFKGRDVSGTADLSGYTDSGSVASYAKDAFGWAVNAGLINGTTATTLSPAGTATRAQVAAILQRLDNKYAK